MYYSVFCALLVTQSARSRYSTIIAYKAVQQTQNASLSPEHNTIFLFKRSPCTHYIMFIYCIYFARSTFDRIISENLNTNGTKHTCSTVGRRDDCILPGGAVIIIYNIIIVLIYSRRKPKRTHTWR